MNEAQQIKKLMEAVALTENSTSISLEFHRDNYISLVKQLTRFYETLEQQGHTASAQDLANVIGAMQQSHKYFTAARKHLNK